MGVEAHPPRLEEIAIGRMKSGQIPAAEIKDLEEVLAHLADVNLIICVYDNVYWRIQSVSGLDLKARLPFGVENMDFAVPCVGNVYLVVLFVVEDPHWRGELLPF